MITYAIATVLLTILETVSVISCFKMANSLSYNTKYTISSHVHPFGMFFQYYVKLNQHLYATYFCLCKHPNSCEAFGTYLFKPFQALTLKPSSLLTCSIICGFTGIQSNSLTLQLSASFFILLFAVSMLLRCNVNSKNCVFLIFNY